MTKAQAEQNLGQGRIDLFECDQRRKAGADAWPREE
jgi:hypothetical protein